MWAQNIWSVQHLLEMNELETTTGKRISVWKEKCLLSGDKKHFVLFVSSNFLLILKKKQTTQFLISNNMHAWTARSSFKQRSGAERQTVWCINWSQACVNKWCEGRRLIQLVRISHDACLDNCSWWSSLPFVRGLVCTWINSEARAAFVHFNYMCRFSKTRKPI